MFDRTQPSKRAKSWRADPGLLSGSHRGFAATRWGGADDGFLVDDIKRTKDGFALDEYAQVPLSPQAIAALKRLQALEPDDNVIVASEVLEAPEPFQIETWNANAHLPFVADAYDMDWDDAHTQHLPNDSSAQSQPEPTVTASLPETAQADGLTQTTQDLVVSTEHAIAQTHDAALMEISDSTASDTDALAQTATPGEDVIEAAVDDTPQNKSEEINEELSAASIEPTSDDATEPEMDAATHVDPEVATAHIDDTAQPSESNDTALAPIEDIPLVLSETAEPASEDTESSGDDTHDRISEIATVDEALEAVSPPEPVMSGISPEEVAQREADKFAEGLAQGIEQGERQARDAMQQEVQAQCAVMAKVTQELQTLLQDSQAFYEPLKRLALHLAEQIVKTELQTSTKALEQLIQACLNELDHPAQGLVVLELNPEDKARLQAQSPELIRGMRLEGVQDLQPGSVRLFANDAVVEDLVEHRLETLAQSMLRDVTTWKAQSQLNKPDRSAQDMESEDVHP